MTSFLDSLLALIVCGVLNLVVSSQIRARVRGAEQVFVLRVFWATIGLRCVLALVLNVYAADSGFAGMFWGDSGTYDAGGWGINLLWRGEAVGTSRYAEALGRYGFYYFVAAVYFVVGRNQLLVQLLNGTIGAVTALVMYALAVHLFDRSVARRVILLMAFFPGMIFWSAGMYKDSAILLCIAASMYAVVRLRDEVSPSMVVLFAAAVGALGTLRFYIAYFVVFATISTVLFTVRGSLVQRVLSYGLLVGAVLVAFNFVVRAEALEEQRSYMTLERIQLTRSDQAALGHSAFGKDIDVSTPTGAIQALPVGLAYLLFAPFPWTAAGGRQAMVIPEMLVWYGLMPAFVAGLVHTVRRQLGSVLPILTFAVSLTLAYALMQGNVGTAYRQRTQITMFFFLFMGVGLDERAKAKASKARVIEARAKAGQARFARR